jgi:outer membrane protein assembly factor BamA
MPKKGINWISTLKILGGQNNASYDVTQLNSEFTFYLKLSKMFVVSNRTGFGHNFGDFEFYQAQYLGNEDHLRGYRKNRFAGYSKVFNNLEFLWAVAKFRTYLFPGYFGLLGFYDAGRVKADVNTTNRWMSGYGGGFWVSPLSRMVLTLTYATSKEDRLVLVGLGWKF